MQIIWNDHFNDHFNGPKTIFICNNPLQVSAEKLALIHNQWTVKLNELAKEVARYAEELHRKHKQVKDEEAPTLAAVKSVQVIIFKWLKFLKG